MFLHIGDNTLMKTKDVIGVFDVKSLKNSNEADNTSKDDTFYNELNQMSNDYKTVVITDKKNYYTNISVATIKKRIDTNYTKGEKRNGK